MGNALQVGQREVGLVPVLSVVLLELIQVGSQQLTYQEEVLLQHVDVTINEYMQSSNDVRKGVRLVQLQVAGFASAQKSSTLP